VARSWPTACLVLIGPLAAFLAARAIDIVGFEVLGLVVLALVLVSVPVAPLALCRPDVAAPRVAGRWWSASCWPGWRIAGVVLLLGAGSALIELGLAAGPDEAGPGIVFLEVVAQLASRVLILAIVVTLLSRDLSPLIRRSFLRWRVLGPWLAYSILVSLLPILLLGPIGAAYLVYWRFLPVVASAHASYGIVLPAAWRISASVLSFVGQHLWLLLLMPGWFLYMLGAARVVWLSSGPSRREGEEDAVLA
jgi:hypothetical protein